MLTVLRTHVRRLVGFGLALAVAWMVLLAPNAHAQVNYPSVHIVNQTGYTIYFLYISSSGTSDWEEDVLGNNTLSKNESIKVNLNRSLSAVNRYDFRLIDKDGDEYIKMNVQISNGSRIIFTLKDMK